MEVSKQEKTSKIFFKPSLLERMIGSSNEGVICCGVKTTTLIDSGSMVTSILESFYESLVPKPISHDMTEFGLSVTSANGTQ